MSWLPTRIVFAVSDRLAAWIVVIVILVGMATLILVLRAHHSN